MGGFRGFGQVLPLVTSACADTEVAGVARVSFFLACVAGAWK